MADKSKIEWTETTWNPVTGCSKISKGCQNCYAERYANRLREMGVKKYCDGFAVKMHPNEVSRPVSWKGKRLVFVNSMGDLFHDDVSLSFIQSVFDIMALANRHIFQVLTKRGSRLRKLSPKLKWSDNIWMGVTVEAADYVDRIDDLHSTGAKVKFLSLEPLLSALPELPLAGIDWVIVGGESGPGARQMEAEWVREIRDNCEIAKTSFFFKQWGGVNRKKSGRLLDGRYWDEMPHKRNEKKSALLF
jgi:protein gp37